MAEQSFQLGSLTSITEPCKNKIEKDIEHLEIQSGESVKGLENASVIITALMDDILKNVIEL